MAKALKIGALVVGAVALAATGIGALALPAIGTLTVAGISTGTLFLAAGALSVGASLLQKKPGITAAQTDRLTASIDPRTPRKTVLGSTAFPVDIRYEEWSGPDQDYCDWIVCFASHSIDGLDEIWFNTDLAWSAARGVEQKFRGYFTLAGLVLEGAPENAISFGGWQGASLTGCAYARFRFKVTGNSKKAESPFSSGPPSRITAIGRGAKLYDPRRDSTVPGGSGPMRADDQSTWRFTADDGATIGDNLPLQILRVVLGWRIQNPVTGEWKLATGSGVPTRRLDLGSWIEAANLADELVNRSAGGQEPRYHGAAVVSEGDDPKTTLDMLCAASCARFRDTGGRLALAIAHNDLAQAALDEGLLDDDVVGPFSWDPDPALEATPNVVRGRYVDATSAGLYQLIDYPEVRIASPDGQDRFFPLDLGACESPSQAQRIGKQKLQRLQYQREFSAPFDIRAWKYGVGDVVPFTFAPLSFNRALFRVKEQELGQGGTCQMTLTVEHQAMYAWDADDRAPVLAAEALVYDASKNPLVLAIADAAETAEWQTGVYGFGKPSDFATNSADPSSPFGPGTVEEALTAIERIQPIAEAQALLELAQGDQAAALAQGKRAAAELEKVLLRAVLENARTRDVLRDAGVIVDPASGTVRIFAIDQVADRTAAVEIALDATRTQLSLKASRDYVSEQIALAQLDPTGQAALDQIIARITSAEVRLDGAEATILLKADATTLTQLGGQVTSVRADLDALAGLVALKAERTDLDQLNARVGSAELRLEVLGDTSRLATTIRQARLAGDEAGKAALASLLTSEMADRRKVTMIAEARQELYARLIDGDAAEAAARTLLSVRVGQGEARAATETLVRASETFALGQRVDGLTATVGSESARLTAAVTSLTKAISDGDTAQAEQTQRLEAYVGTMGAGIDAEFARSYASQDSLFRAIVTEQDARASAIQQVTSRLDGVGGVTIEQQLSTLVDRTGRIEGRYAVAIDANGRLQGFQLIGSASGPAQFSFIDTDLRMGTGRIIFNNGAFMQVQGVGFGAQGDLLEWYGPTMAVASCSRANAISYKTISGDAYFGGTLSAGTFRNTSTSTTTASTSNVLVGPFRSNGRSREIVVSYEMYGSARIDGACPIPAPAAPKVTIDLFRGSDATGALLDSRELTGSYSCTPGFGASEPGAVTDQIMGSFTLTDTAAGDSFSYFARIRGRSTYVGATMQTLSLISTEE